MSSAAAASSVASASRVDVTAVHAAVDRVVMAHGIYAPWELLLEQGRLDYADYEAWRSGKLALLADGLHGNFDRIEALLAVAERWVCARGFQADTAAPTGWGAAAGRVLRGARGGVANRLLTAIYRPDAAAVQRDLFVDSGETMLLVDLRTALAARDPHGAMDALHALLRRAPAHRLRAAAERLCDALAEIAADAHATLSVADELARLEGPLAIDASDLLGESARDFTIPFWRRLAVALGDTAFDPQEANLHASFTLARCLDWRASAAAVAMVPAFEANSVLFLRLIAAEQHLGKRAAVLSRYCELCWRHPDVAERCVDSDPSVDRALQRAWEQLLDLDTEGTLGVSWLPAWLLLQEPGLAHVLDITAPPDGAAASAGFMALRKMLERPGAELDATAIGDRKALAAAHPLLLSAYLAGA